MNRVATMKHYGNHRLACMIAVLVFASILTAFMKDKKNDQTQKFAGKWLMTVSGQPFLVLSLKVVDKQLVGIMTRPEHFQIDAEGDITNITSGNKELQLVQKAAAFPHVQLSAKTESDPENFELTFVDNNNILLKELETPIQPWKLKRVDENQDIKIATQWPAPQAKSREISLLQEELRNMVTADQAARKPLDMAQMKAIDEKHYPRLLEIYQKYGWPTISLVGKEAAGNYWLLVQHQGFEFQKMVLPAMERAVTQGEASKAHYAELYDRVMVAEGKPQHWGTQVKCKDGKAVPYDVDDPTNLDQRRTELNLWPERDYLKMFCQTSDVSEKK